MGGGPARGSGAAYTAGHAGADAARPARGAAVRLTTKALTTRTWPDFEALFTRGNGCDFCACMFFQRGRHLPRSQYPSRAAMAAQNRAEKRALVLQGRAHGILVYADGEVVGWCQYGPVDELPIGGRGQPGPTEADWRITCLVTDKAHRHRGVSHRALRAALAAIRRQGGGLVESYPVVWEATERLRTRFPDCGGARRARDDSASWRVPTTGRDGYRRDAGGGGLRAGAHV